MYLSRLILNGRSRSVRRDLADCQALHRTIMSAFPQAPNGPRARAELGVLYRLENHVRTGTQALLVQSDVAPDWSSLPLDYLTPTYGEPRNPDCKAVAGQYDAIREGMQLMFRLRANPTRKIDTRSGPDGRRRNGKRVELTDESAQVAWLSRKGGQGGFQVLAVQARPDVRNARAVDEGKVIGRRPSTNGATQAASQLTFASVLFEGVLRVTDSERFRATLKSGMGTGKAYGFGLLSVGRAPG